MGANKNKRSGKALQSEVAKNWNGKNTGTLGGEDVEHPIFSIECKHRNRRTELQTFLEQAERHCPPDKTALVVFHQKGQIVVPKYPLFFWEEILKAHEMLYNSFSFLKL